MKVEQISVFLENKAGRMAEVTKTLAEADINIRALSLADTSEFGILRLIVDDYEAAKAALKKKGFTVSCTSVVAVEVPHTPGGLNNILQIMGAKGINVEYMYGFPNQNSNNASIIFRFDRAELAIDILQKNNVRIMPGSEVYGA